MNDNTVWTIVWLGILALILAIIASVAVYNFKMLSVYEAAIIRGLTIAEMQCIFTTRETQASCAVLAAIK